MCRVGHQMRPKVLLHPLTILHHFKGHLDDAHQDAVGGGVGGGGKKRLIRMLFVKGRKVHF